MAFLKVSSLLLLIAGEIESNPGPATKNQKVVLGSFHQGHPKFGDTAGINNELLCI